MTYDSSSKSEFLLKARLLWAIHDFPALGTLSGCVTHGYYGCPTCGEGTVAEWLPYSKKICYMGHRRWLPAKHKFRLDKSNFNGSVEHGEAPWPMTGEEIKDKVADITIKKGKGKQPADKKRKRKAAVQDEDVADDHTLFSRRSIFFMIQCIYFNYISELIRIKHTYLFCYFLAGLFYMICRIGQHMWFDIKQMSCIPRRT